MKKLSAKWTKILIGVASITAALAISAPLVVSCSDSKGGGSSAPGLEVKRDFYSISRGAENKNNENFLQYGNPIRYGREEGLTNAIFSRGYIETFTHKNPFMFNFCYSEKILNHLELKDTPLTPTLTNTHFNIDKTTNPLFWIPEQNLYAWEITPNSQNWSQLLQYNNQTLNIEIPMDNNADGKADYKIVHNLNFRRW
ncbi:MAG: hypothetical protein ACRC4L_00035 [Mycoplasma sp.]